MASIKISDITPSGYDLFADSESYLTDLSETELNTTGGWWWFVPIFFLTTTTLATPQFQNIGTRTLSIESIPNV